MKNQVKGFSAPRRHIKIVGLSISPSAELIKNFQVWLIFCLILIIKCSEL
ncbi:MAG: hypothetical protein LH614_16935 [Pyrinomonadaceae bacterium]|nr:hypothetical protein [Pyrinomonadaceae bacterium]